MHLQDIKQYFLIHVIVFWLSAVMLLYILHTYMKDVNKIKIASISSIVTGCPHMIKLSIQTFVSLSLQVWMVFPMEAQ